LKVVAVIVAAGRGERLKGSVSKQFIEIEGKSILLHTLEKFEQCPDVDEIVVVVPKLSVGEVRDKVNIEWCLKKVSAVVQGGTERYDSVQFGLKAVSANADIILIHDGVRPCVSVGLIERVIRACQQHGAVIVGVTPKDTIKEKSGNFVSKTLVRDSLIVVQTPQAFKRDLIMRAYEKASDKKTAITDDAALVEELTHPVAIIEGEYSNIKITSAEDLILAKALLKRKNQA